MKPVRFAPTLFAFVLLFAASLAWAQTVKITPLGSHAGEFCATDRALLLEDPTGVRILWDAGRSVAGGTDPRLGEVHVVLLSHAHADHIGDTKLAGLDAGTCEKPQTVSAAPNSNTAEIAAAKNSVLVTSNDMGLFLAKKIQAIRGAEVPLCAETGLGRETSVPVSAPCRASLQLGGKRTIRLSAQSRGVQIVVVYAAHSNNAPRSLLTDPEKANLASDNLTAYVGHANGYVLTFTNGLKVYLSGDTGLMSEMKTVVHDFYRVNLAVLNLGGNALPSREAAFAVNKLIQPKAVIPSHANEGATSGGRLKPGSRTKEFADLAKRARVHLPLSARTMEFDGNAKCRAGC